MTDIKPYDGVHGSLAGHRDSYSIRSCTGHIVGGMALGSEPTDAASSTLVSQWRYLYVTGAIPGQELVGDSSRRRLEMVNLSILEMDSL